MCTLSTFATHNIALYYTVFHCNNSYTEMDYFVIHLIIVYCILATKKMLVTAEYNNGTSKKHEYILQNIHYIAIICNTLNYTTLQQNKL